MKSLSRIHSSASARDISPWRVSDLDVQSNVTPAEVQAEQILAFFGVGSKSAASKKDSEYSSKIHSNGTALSLTNWLPEEIDLEPQSAKQEAWEFAHPTSDFFTIPEKQIWQEKFEAEKERIDIVKNARTQAETILNDARAEAEKIIVQARHEIDHAKQQAYEEVRSELQSTLAAVHAVIEETHEWQAALMKDSEQTLMDMLKEIAQTIFGEGVHLDSNALQVNLNRIMENAQRLGDLTIFLNPEDANQLDSSWRDYQLLVTGNKVRIIPSQKIKPGGCVIKGNTGMVDARVETQLSAVLNAIDEVNEGNK